MAKAVQSQNPFECKITQEFLKNSVSYDPLTGIFLWLKRADRSIAWNTLYSGKHAGTRKPDNRIYLSFKIDGVKKSLFAHRLAFLYMEGRWPIAVDHKDGNPSNNRWDNLREATVSQNMQNRAIQSNNKTGLKGVDWKSDKKKWRATIHVDGRQKHLGYFVSEQDAHAAYHAASIRYYGDFACAGTR